MVKPIIRSKTRREFTRPNGIVELTDKKGLVGIEKYKNGTLRRVLRRRKRPLTREQVDRFTSRR